MTQITNEKTINYAIKGFSWNVAGNATRAIAGFAINILLARILGPEPFGVVALALLVIGIGNLVIESGLGSALVQKETIDRADIAFVFTLQMVFSISLALLLITLAPWLSIQFDTPTAAPVLQVMASVLALQAFAQVPSALLRRKMDFKRLQLAQIVSFFAGFACLGLPLALAGFGVWSLVAAQVTQSGLNALLVFLFSRHSLAVTFKGSRHIAIFGIRTLAANIASWIILYIDQAIIGRRFGAKNLGFYSRAYYLNSTPNSIIMASAQAALFSAVSRIGKGPETIRIFSGFINGFAVFLFPVYWFIALEAKTIIELIYGSAWLPAAALLTPLAIAMPFLALLGLEGPVLNGLGKPQYEMRAQWVTAVFAILLLTAASRVSILTVAWSIVIIYFVRLAIMSLMTINVLEIPWWQLLRPMLSGVLMALVAASAWYVAILFISTPQSLIFTLLIRGIIVLLTCVLAFWAGHKWLFPQAKPLLVFLIKNKAGFREREKTQGETNQE